MIGTISTGKSFYHCISYCLEDKRDMTEEQKLTQAEIDGLQHQNRAEILEYNLCFGNKQELTDQFRDVQKLSKRVEKPVLHLSLRLATGEFLTHEQLTDMGRKLAEAFDVADKQYFTVLHKDTREQHIHLVANRVGYNGKAVSTSNNYLKMDRLCRRLEKEYQLKEVLSARRFLSKEQRLIPRHDTRKERLGEDIRQTLEKVWDYTSFERHMQSLGYQVIKGRGVSFIDGKKVKIKGSEVGFSYAKIEKILALKQRLRIKQSVEKAKREVLKIRSRDKVTRPFTPAQKMIIRHIGRKEAGQSPIEELEKQISNLLHEMMRPEPMNNSISAELLREAKRKKKHRQHN